MSPNDEKPDGLKELEKLAPPECICYFGMDQEFCVCNDLERTLRSYLYSIQLQAMTVVQREACLEEIARVEGFERADYEATNDKELARGVLRSWASYCQDKGLL